MESPNKMPIIQRILEKKRLLSLNNPDHHRIKTLLLLDSGGMRGIIGAGYCAGLEMAGLSNIFDVVVGVSAGAVNGAFFLSQQSQLLRSIYIEDLTKREFINFLRLSKIVNIDYLTDYVFRQVKIIDSKTVIKSRSEFYVTVTRIDNGEGEFINVKTQPDIIIPIKASIAMPILYNRSVRIADKNYLDGLIGFTLPIQEVVDKFQPTDVLVMLNRPLLSLRRELSWLEKRVSKIYIKKFGNVFVENFFKMNKKYSKALHLLTTPKSAFPNININVIYPNTKVPLLTKNRSLLTNDITIAQNQILKLFTEK